MENAGISDGEARAMLLAAARRRIVDGADFPVAVLLSSTGINRTQFRRCFPGKKALLAALTEEDARGLSEILDVAQPAVQVSKVAHAVGSDVTPTPMPTPTNINMAAPVLADAWLERRLRVFERALGALEKSQEKSGQDTARHLALLEEKLAALAAAPLQQPQITPMPLPVTFDPAECNLLPADPASSQTGPSPSPDSAPSVLAHIEQIAAATAAAPISEKEIDDFLAHARKAARAAMPSAPPSRRRRRLREAVTLSLILVGGLVVISATLLLASAGPRAMPIPAGISYRQGAQDPAARLVALADNGDAAAQTSLARAYLKSGDRQAASRWALAAASQGQPLAQYLLGVMGMEDNHDAQNAVRWLAAAARAGNIKAMHNLAIAYAQGQGVPADATLAVQWFSRAAQLGYRDSQFDLAVLYERGLGVAQSAPDALKWYLVAAGEGDAPSAARAEALKGAMTQADVRLASAAAAGFVAQPANLAANAVPGP